jgi:hypothetical protein
VAISIPGWVRTVDGFRRWLHSDDFPESGQICFLGGEIWVDLTQEQIFSHNQVRGEYNLVLGRMAKESRRGRYIPAGAFFVNEQVGICCQPDGGFVSLESMRSGRIGFGAPGEKEAFEVEGTLDVVLEIVSTSSVVRDTEILPKFYWRAGIPEYWLVDARGERPAFDVFRHGPRGYIANRKQNGWIKSAVFGKSFRLTCGKDDLGHPAFTLHVRG